jgi:two-component system, chemotaxis family, response regulator Rcp1
MNVQPARILLVEDSPGDVRLTQEALRDAKICNQLHVARDGESALAHLRREGADIVLLDLGLPRLDGREVLRAMQADERLRQIPVIVLTVSAAEGDALRSSDLHAHAYVTKPIELDSLIAVVRSITSLWLSIVYLPSE